MWAYVRVSFSVEKSPIKAYQAAALNHHYRHHCSRAPCHNRDDECRTPLADGNDGDIFWHLCLCSRTSDSSTIEQQQRKIRTHWSSITYSHAHRGSVVVKKIALCGLKAQE